MAADLSYDELHDAWLRVQENEGCAGVDGVTLDLFARRAEANLRGLSEALRNGSYRPLPLLRILVEKAPGSAKTRRLLVPPIVDRIAQTACARRWSRSWEPEFLESSFAYRPGRSVDRAVARVIQLRDFGLEHVVDGDITSFFDSVPHALLLHTLKANGLDAADLNLVEAWLRVPVWDGRRLTALRMGLPQGSPLSPLLANMFLTPLDIQVESSGNHLVRYADDFLILCPSPEAAQLAAARATEALSKLGLTLNPVKTRITSFAVGFTFLGVFFFGNRAWIPWKHAKPQGGIVAMAPRMPPARLAAFLAPRQRVSLGERFRQAGIRPHDYASGPSSHSQGVPAVAFLYLTEQGAVLRKSGDRFLVEKDDRILRDLPYHKLEHVLVFGNVQITTQSIAELLDKGIDVSFFTRQGRLRGSLTPLLHRNLGLRLAQYGLHRAPERSIALARRLVQAKLANGEQVLEKYAARSERPVPPQHDEHLAVIRQARFDAAAAADMAALAGLEGAAARSYFAGVMAFNRSPFSWPGRVRHPPTDPINSLLSLTYTLLMSELMSLCEAHGLDPFLGFFHQPDIGRPSLALDLIEPFRHPVADRLVLTLLNRSHFRLEHFSSAAASGAVTLLQEPLREFLACYESWMLAGKGSRKPFRDCLRHEVESFSSALEKEKEHEWQPYLWTDLE